MNDYKNKIALINAKIKNLKERELLLFQDRKKFIGELGERLNILTLPDTLIAGSLVALKEAATSHSPQLLTWEKWGDKFLNGSKKLSRSFTGSTTTKTVNKNETINE